MTSVFDTGHKELGFQTGTYPPFSLMALNARLKKSCIIGTFFLSNWPKKIWLFLNIYGNASHILSDAQNDLKKGFCSIFVINMMNLEMWFFGLFCG